MNKVACGNCGFVLTEDPSTEFGKRQPCPRCGSKSRNFSVPVSVSASGFANVGVRFIVRDPPKLIDLMLQTVVVRGDKTTEGHLIEAVTIPWLEIIGLLEKDPQEAFKIPPRTWEEIIAGAYKKAGFETVILTPQSGDYGRDIIAIKKGLGTVRIIDQVKAFSPDHLVTANDVRALMGVLQGDGASKGFVTTTSNFAPRLQGDPLIAPYIPSRLELINGKALLKRLSDLKRVVE
ncbi:MAG: restriction endonuclease [bacterium]